MRQSVDELRVVSCLQAVLRKFQQWWIQRLQQWSHATCHGTAEQATVPAKLQARTSIRQLHADP